MQQFHGHLNAASFYFVKMRQVISSARAPTQKMHDLRRIWIIIRQFCPEQKSVPTKRIPSLEPTIFQYLIRRISVTIVYFKPDD